MTKSSPAELAELREGCFARDDWTCKWPGCKVDQFWTGWLGGDITNELQMAHIQHRGMGGSKEANRLENVITLCRFHHDIFDGRDGSANVKRELAVMLRAQIKETR